MKYCVIIIEHIPNTFTPTQINGRIKKMVSKTSGNDKTTPDNQQTDGYYWKVSFEEGIDPTDINDDQLPKSGDENRGFLNLKLVHTQWRYDFGFITPTCMFMLAYCLLFDNIHKSIPPLFLLNFA